MSKNRLQNIVNKLQLVKKDKTELVNIINSNSITKELKNLGIEYDNVVINVTIEEINEMADSEVIPKEHRIIPILEKATKALNVTLIIVSNQQVFNIIPCTHKKRAYSEHSFVFSRIDVANSAIDGYSVYTFRYDGMQWYLTLDEI